MVKVLSVTCKEVLSLLKLTAENLSWVQEANQRGLIEVAGREEKKRENKSAERDLINLRRCHKFQKILNNLNQHLTL
jgi:hypothetical protein